MSGLRFIGVINAAIWFGAAVSFTFFVGPAFFSPKMLGVFPGDYARYYAGAAAQVIITRYFVLHSLCATIALVHLLAEWFYFSRRPSRTMLVTWVILTVLILFGALKAQPNLHMLHQTMYNLAASPDVRDAAKNSFGHWHAASQIANLFVLLGLLIYFWKITKSSSNQHMGRR